MDQPRQVRQPKGACDLVGSPRAHGKASPPKLQSLPPTPRCHFIVIKQCPPEHFNLKTQAKFHSRKNDKTTI
ncbi:hypothetical protein CSV60_12705 [Sporosarcina sp. P7]|nr:hypothetical protein CSV60_12705 [Sporosarcina sp. P7]